MTMPVIDFNKMLSIVTTPLYRIEAEHRYGFRVPSQFVGETFVWGLARGWIRGLRRRWVAFGSEGRNREAVGRVGCFV
jgi:hypothetical protein